jgi:hypothetical protein
MVFVYIQDADCAKPWRFTTIVADKFGSAGIDAWTGLFIIPLSGADGVLGTGDDPYVIKPEAILSNPTALKPLLGYEVHSPHALYRR